MSAPATHAPAKPEAAPHDHGHGADAHGHDGAHGAEAHGEHGDGHGDGHGGGHHGGGHHKHHEHDHGPGTPPWLISFGDMMTLFLCFFIMLVTMAKTQDAGLMARGIGPFIASLEMNGDDGAMRGSEVITAINRYRTRFGLDPLTEDEFLTGRETPKSAADIEKLIRSSMRSSFMIEQPAVAQFAVESYELGDDGRHYLDLLADSMRPGQGQMLVLEGFATDGGDAYENGLLALRRAQAVAQYFIEEHGFVAARVEPRAWPRPTKKGSGQRAVDARLLQPVEPATE